ncbi:MAG: hypothetical protein A2939_05570 [Parcubacteria group bacterium RIFCSPLOWO2_01_FULL_48_18]|nr:MAG: hypothetical protein A3J67_01030 [Parcubacteria group bacterium RIFCSPHIGHO2_02_FULL_48_10b]OHB22564.1 MAG: hypothetical protein A2939_05570 [Parcubacteria group bacterium RIFCSPLOWO2_01_FULL_48_18]
MTDKVKNQKQMERHFKGVANHRRIEILMVIAEHEGVTLDNLSRIVSCNFKTLSEHTRRLVQAGLINKKYHGRFVRHTLSPYGRMFYKFIVTLRHS